MKMWEYEKDEGNMKVLASQLTQEPSFWKERYEDAKAKQIDVNNAVNAGFDWSFIDPIHEKIIKEHIEPNQRILEIGCGMGRSSKWFPDEHYTGIDFIEEFVEEARRFFPKKTFLIGDVKKPLPFDDKEFDWVVGVSFKSVVCPNVSEDTWKQMMGEFKRVANRVLFLEFANGVPEETAKFEYL